MATISNPSSSLPTSRLEQARKKWDIIEKIAHLRRQNFLEEEDVERIPSMIPINDEELNAFMQQLFQYGVKKHMPGCPVRLNRNVVSVRLDGLQFRRAKEMRELFEKSGIRNYISEKDRELYRAVEGNTSSPLRGNGYTEFIQEEGRDFYHIPSTVNTVGSGGSSLGSIYQSIVTQGRSDVALNAHYETFMGHVKERNEERRREFIRNRTQLNSEYIQHVVNTLTIPLEHLNNPELVAALREAGIVAFIKQPKLNELVSTEIMVDVYSAPNEEDETWKIMPVTPEIVESTDEVLYHGQGTITSFDPTSSASKNGTLPFVIQHCLRAGADIADFISVLPEEFRNNLATCNELYLNHTGNSSESLDKAGLEREYQQTLHELTQRAAQESILSAPTVSGLVEESRQSQPDIDRDVVASSGRGMSRDELDRLVREAFDSPVTEDVAVERAQSTVVDSLTQSLIAQMQQGLRQTSTPSFGQATDYTPSMADADDDLPFESEPAVEEATVTPTPEPVGESLADTLVRQLREQQAQRQQAQAQPSQPTSAYHEYYGNNPIFAETHGDGTTSYVAFRGQEDAQVCQTFTNFNAAAIYSGKTPGTVIVYKYENRHRPAVGSDPVFPMQFDGRLSL